MFRLAIIFFNRFACLLILSLNILRFVCLTVSILSIFFFHIVRMIFEVHDITEIVAKDSLSQRNPQEIAEMVNVSVDPTLHSYEDCLEQPEGGKSILL